VGSWQWAPGGVRIGDWPAVGLGRPAEPAGPSASS
jgi:hypothetical protein